MKYLKMFESYQSQKDLEKLTKSICYKIAEDTYDNFIDMKFDSIDFFVYVELNEFTSSDYDVLGKFITKFSDMVISMVSKEDTNNREGVYINYEGGKFIYLLEKEDVLDKFNNVLKFNDDGGYIKDKFRELVYSSYKNSLIHELQHAYDDYRSDGKYHNTSKEYYNKRDKVIELSKKKKLKEEELDFIKSHEIEYLNLRYEVDARFTDAISNIDFYEIDETNDMFIIYPFPKILKDFKSEMWMTYHHIKDEKRVLKKLAQFYQIEKDFVNKKNKEKN